MSSKQCRKCKKIKTNLEFYKNTKLKDRLHSYCKSCHKEEVMLWQIKNQKKVCKYKQKYAISDRNRKLKRFYHKKRRSNDINYKILLNLRTRLSSTVKNNFCNETSRILLGCSISNLRKHLELQFKEGMTWDNYGRKKGIRCWEIDHIRPCASFDLSKESEQHKCFHYTNLQPLWGKENREKGQRYNDE